MKKELSRKAKLSICRSVNIPTFTYIFAVTERTRLQAAEMMFRLRTAGLRGSVRS